MKPVLTIFCLLLALTCRGQDGEKKAAPEASPFRVTISPQKIQERRGEQFKVTFQVKNISDVVQSFEVMGGNYSQHWRSSDPRVLVMAFPSGPNPWEKIELKPSEVYEKPYLLLMVQDDKAQKEIKFRLGFTPINSKTTYWSNETTLEIVK